MLPDYLFKRFLQELPNLTGAQLKEAEDALQREIVLRFDGVPAVDPVLGSPPMPDTPP